MNRFEVIPARRWRHTSGQTASVYGAAPWRSASEMAEWEVEDSGWTVRNPHNGQVGACRPPFATKGEAEAFADRVKPSRIGYGD
jgi:hypothetical protein